MNFQNTEVKNLTVFFMIFAFAFLSGCTTKVDKKVEVTLPSEVPILKEKRPQIPELKKGYYKDSFGFVSDVFREKPGGVRVIEGIISLKTIRGDLWVIATQPYGDNRPLFGTERKIYLVKVSREHKKKKCGIRLQNFQSIPPNCVEEERILSWQEAKDFIFPNLSDIGKSDWERYEKYLIKHEWKE